MRDLDMSGNSIDSEGMLIIREYLPQCSSLTKLNLSRNNIGPDGGETLAAALPFAKALVELDLSQCGLYDIGTRAIVGGVLGFNRFDDHNADGGADGGAGGRGGRKAGGVRILNLQRNQVAKRSILSIVDMLEETRDEWVLEEVDMTENKNVPEAVCDMFLQLPAMIPNRYGIVTGAGRSP
jgi:hypothetical protein